MVLQRLALATVLCLWLITGLSAQVVGAQAPPTISLSRDCGSPGGALTVSGSGFPPNTPVVLRYDQVTVSQPSTDTAGSFVSTFSVPNVGAGVHTVIAMTTSASDQAPHTVPCAPAPTSTAPPAAIALSRSCGRPGENLVVTGSGFPPTSPIDIRYDGVVASQLSTDTKGSFATAFRIPNVRPGDHTVNATSARVSANASHTVPCPPPPTPTFTVTPAAPTVIAPAIGLSATCGAPGEVLTVSGSRYPAFSAVNVSYDELQMLQVSTDSLGRFNAAFMIPNVCAGVRTVRATTEGASASAPHTIGCPAPPIVPIAPAAPPTDTATATPPATATPTPGTLPSLTDTPEPVIPPPPDPPTDDNRGLPWPLILGTLFGLGTATAAFGWIAQHRPPGPRPGGRPKQPAPAPPTGSLDGSAALVQLAPNVTLSAPGLVGQATAPIWEPPLRL